MSGNGSPERHWLRSVAILTVGALGGYAVGSASNFDLFGHLHVPGFDMGTDPAHSEASVDQNSYEIKATFDVFCNTLVGGAVDARGFKNGPFGDGVVEKRYYWDALWCGDLGKLEASGTIKKDSNGKVIQVTAIFPGAALLHPRINDLDYRNCVDLDPGESEGDVEKAIIKYNQEKAHGHTPECDDGFRVTQAAGSHELSQVIEVSRQAALLAVSLDANPGGELSSIQDPNTTATTNGTVTPTTMSPELRQKIETSIQAKIAARTVELKNRMRDFLQGEYPGAAINILDPTVQTPEEILADRVNAITSELKNLFKSYEFRLNDKNELEFYAETYHDGHVTITFTENIEVGDLSNLNVLTHEGPQIDRPSVLPGLR